jgi:hypothetical protein
MEAWRSEICMDCTEIAFYALIEMKCSFEYRYALSLDNFV